MKAIVFAILLLNITAAYSQKPALYLINPDKVASVKKSAISNDKIKTEIKQLAKQADKLLQQKFGSVMDKAFVPPCGNKHEYMSMARYYWPDPSKPDGKPYIKKDSEKNPANDLVTDDKNFDDLIAAVNTLAWAYYFTDNAQYAAKATDLVRFWFIDTATRMLPNLNHAQIRTGIDTGVSTGIIDTHSLPEVVDAIGLLRRSKYWKPADEKGTKQWFADYLHWLLTSSHGKKEAKAPNNHGTFYEMQVMTIALFCGETAIADKLIKTAPARIDSQITSDGKQPMELARTLALSYSTFNLDAWFRMANVAEARGADLWHYQSADGRSIKKAIDYLVPYTTGGKQFNYPQISPYKAQDFYRLLLIAAEKYKDDSYRKQADKIKDSNKNVLVKILYEP